MKRKIIKQGHNTLTITLPKDWTKKLNLKAGDEINLLEKENGLFLTSERKNERLITEIDITSLDIPSIWKYFMAFYREGYDEIKVKFNPDKLYNSPYKYVTTYAENLRYGKKSKKCTSFETLQGITSRFIGFEIIEHHEDYCIIKEITEPSSKEFESSLRRIFLLIQQMGEEIIKSIKTNNTKVVRNTEDIDINVDRFHDYCIRVLNKTALLHTKKTNILFATLHILELIGDEFRSIANHLIEDMKGRTLNNLLPLAEMITEQFNEFYVLFYSFDINKVVEMSKRDLDVHFYLPKLYKKKGKKSLLSDDELEIFNHFRRISKHINSIVELRIEMEF